MMLLKRGRWPSRVGSEPHCLKCDYLLIGLASDRCPECGAPIIENAIVHGHRVRRPRVAWCGVAMILVAMVILLPALVEMIRSIDWYRVEPAFMLIREVKSGANPNRALDELIRREVAGSLSLASKRDLADVALAAQAASNPPALANDLLLFGQRQYATGVLSDA